MSPTIGGGMAEIKKPATREIIKDFAEEINSRKIECKSPSKMAINFRKDWADGKESKVWSVPTAILRYRKYNGRIASDVLHYERNIGPLKETDDQDQRQLFEFLEQKDPERTEALMKSIKHSGQREPAIITCDGFLINGNRRKMVMEKLLKENPGEDNFKFMKVVILPGEEDEGGPPTLVEIEEIENRYQLQSDGKSEYYGFDRALSIKRKIELGFSLEQQLRDDPRFAGASKGDIKKKIKEYNNKYLDPLECIDRYLNQFNRDGLYRTVSAGMSDREGRWQAFTDYSDTYKRFFANQKRLIEYGIEEEEVGDIEEAAFNIIRLRHLPDLPKVHTVMRNLHKYCRTKEGKKAIKKISEEVEPSSPNDFKDDNGEHLPFDEVDAKWAAKNKQHIIYNLKKAIKSHENLKEKETPLELLEAAYKKLTHEDMDLSTISLGDHPTARSLASKIQKKANELENEIYQYEKQIKKFKNKKP